jgi:UDP-N-acetylmuramoylalanine--D-glutamate ligase
MGRRKAVVILGGDGKGQDFTPLKAAVEANARAVILIGRDAPLIGSAIAHSGVDTRHAATLPEAVQLASRLAQPGDAVLLSPACASFDMFRNYLHRAEVFVAAVSALAAEKAEPPSDKVDSEPGAT